MIVDASVAIKWLVVEEDGELARALLATEPLIVPDIIAAEIANAMWKKRRRGEITALPESFASVLDLVDRIEPTFPLMTRAAAIAIALDHPAYDCFYLALAESLGDAVVTADRKFLNRLHGSDFAHLAFSLAGWADAVAKRDH